MRFGTNQARPQWLQVGVGIAVIVATYLYLIFIGSSGLSDTGVAGTNRLIALAGYLAGAALIIWGVSRQFTTSTYALIPVAIALNIVIGQIVRLTRLPVYLDTVGTVLVGVLAGPWAGAVAGGLSNVIAGLTIDPVSLPFAVVAIVIGFVAGIWTRLGWMKKFYLPPFAGIVTGVIAAFLSAPLSAFIYGGATGTGMDVLVGAFRAAGNSVLLSSLYQGLTADPPDKLVTFVLVYLIVVALPPRLRARFSQSPKTVNQLPQ